VGFARKNQELTTGTGLAKVSIIRRLFLFAVFVVSLFCVLVWGIFLAERVMGRELTFHDALLRGAVIALVAAPFIYRYVRYNA